MLGVAPLSGTEGGGRLTGSSHSRMTAAEARGGDPMTECHALDLFGGTKAVHKKLSEAVRNKLKEKAWIELEQFEYALRLEPLTLERVIKGERGVDYVLFEAISPLL